MDSLLPFYTVFLFPVPHEEYSQNYISSPVFLQTYRAIFGCLMWTPSSVHSKFSLEALLPSNLLLLVLLSSVNGITSPHVVAGLQRWLPKPAPCLDLGQPYLQMNSHP